MTPGAAPARPRLRVVIAEDAVLLREGLRRVLTDAGLDVAGTAGDAVDLVSLVAAIGLVFTPFRAAGLARVGADRPRLGHHYGAFFGASASQSAQWCSCE